MHAKSAANSCATVIAAFATIALLLLSTGQAYGVSYSTDRFVIPSGITNGGAGSISLEGGAGYPVVGSGEWDGGSMSHGYWIASSSNYIPGDADGSGTVDIDDVVFLISYIFGGGDPPVPEDASDANCNGQIDIDDVVYLINYIFGGGPAPCEGQGAGGSSSKVFVGKGEMKLVGASTDHEKSLSIVISAEREVQAMQLEFTLTEGATDISVSSVVDGIQAYYGTVDGVLRVGLLDPFGQTMMSADRCEVARIKYGSETELELIKSVVVAKGGGRIDVAVTRTDAGAIVPDQFALAQNHPNPFNPTTRIDFSLPEQSHVRLDVYNIMGQKVRTLVDDARAAGSHSVIWNGSNDNGEQVASGVYFYRIESGRFSETRKMVLMK